MSDLVTDDIDRCTEEVAAQLAGLPERERAELLTDLREHLAEVVAEGGTLGDPAAYAAELLRSTDARPAVARGRWAALPIWLLVTAAVVLVLVLLLGVVSVGHTQPVPQPSQGLALPVMLR